MLALQTLMIVIPLEPSILTSLRRIFPTVYYHPEFWDVCSWSSIDIEATQKLFDKTDPKEWQEMEMVLLGVMIPMLKERKRDCPNLKWIQLRAVGAEIIFQTDLMRNEPRDSDLKVVTISGVPSPSIAQHVFMLILSLYRRLDHYFETKQKKEWARPEDRYDNFVIPDITAQTIGILGYGSIGREVARLARGWGMTVKACNTDGRKKADSSYRYHGTGDPEGDLPSEYFSTSDEASFKSFLSSIDILVLTLPSYKGTHGIVNSQTLSYLKPSAILINVARGTLIDQPALVDALKAGTIAGAGLDVVAREPPKEDDEIWRVQNCVLTPHMSYMVKGFWERVVEMIEENVGRFREGKDIFNNVSFPKS